MIFVIPVLISLVSLGISCYMAYLQYRYADADYEYKRDPVITALSDRLRISKKEINGEIVSVPSIGEIHIEIGDENNLESVYAISPNYEVKEMAGVNYTKEIEEYFEEYYSDGKADLTINGYSYFYQFLLFTGIDDTVEINLFYMKADEYVKEPGEFIFQFEKVDKINLISLEKGNRKSPEFEGERIMAEQYRVLADYYNDLL